MSRSKIKSCPEQYKMPLYILKQNIPGAKAGTIFYYDKDDAVKGSIAAGCLKMAWSEDGNCQNGLTADTIVFHADVRKDKVWFERVLKEEFVDSGITYQGETLYRKVLK